MDSWQDYTAQNALLPAAGWLVATVVGIHSLWLPAASKRRLLAIVVYGLITAGLAVWYDYNGAQTVRSGRDTSRNIQTLLALSGISSGDGVNQGLDRLISRNLQPRQIIPTQEEELANAFSVIKSSLPHQIFITTLPSSTSDAYAIVYPIQRALARNGIQTPIAQQIATSPRETCLMFTMPDPSHPPDFALPLRDAFGLAGIRDIQFVQMAQEARPMGFSIFVGPAPLK